jgi:hypothetical protein
MAKVFVLLSGQYIQIRAAIADRMAVCELPQPNPNRFPKGIVSPNMTNVLAWTSLTSCMATSICLRYILQALRTPMMCAGIVRPRRSGRGTSATATTRFGYGMEQRIDDQMWSRTHHILPRYSFGSGTGTRRFSCYLIAVIEFVSWWRGFVGRKLADFWNNSLVGHTC